MSPRQVLTWLAWVNTADAASAHGVLTTKSWLRKDAHPRTEGGRVGFPLTHAPPLEELVMACADILPLPHLEEATVELHPPAVPHATLAHAVQRWMEEHEINPALGLLEQLPKKWERLGELVLLPHGTFSQPDWTSVNNHQQVQTLYKAIAESLGGRSLALQAPIANDGYRSAQTVLLHGSTEVQFRDHDVVYAFDAGRVMWSSGNVTERRRIGQLDLTGETVVDAYAGVGYYALQMLVNGGAKHVHACEWNPPSIEGLRTSAALNGVEHRLTVHEGDNAPSLAKLEGVADRVHLGLLPSSEGAWKAAIKCLSDEGGWLHVHMNVEENRLEEWTKATVERLNEMAATSNRPWMFVPKHLERVKWFSPRVRHVVLDVSTAAKVD